MTKIYFSANCHSSPGEMSGGDIRFREIIKRIEDFKKIIITSKFGYDIYKKEKIKAKYILTSKEKKKKNIFLSYLERTLKSLFLDLKISEDDILYSASDFLPDVLPAYYWKKKYDAKWIALLHLLAPNPFYGSEQGYLIKKKIKIPRINDVFYKIGQLISIKFIKWKADKILVVNKEIKKYLIEKEIEKGRITIIDNGVDYEEIQKIESFDIHKYDAVFIGRFHPQKGLFDLVKIWNKICLQRKDVKLVVIGSGPKKFVNKVRYEIEKQSLRENIELLGYLDGKEKFEIIKSSRIFVFPSRDESWGIVNMEAMACGLPVVAYDLPPYENIFKKGMIKIPIGNIEKFAEKVMQLLDDKNLYEKMSKDAQELASKYDWDEIVKKELEIMKELWGNE